MEKNNNRRNRSVLKSYFQKGDVPTEQQFAELIDSVSNIVEDGQVMRTPSGWEVFGLVQCRFSVLFLLIGCKCNKNIFLFITIEGL